MSDNRVHQRILELALTADEAGNSLLVTAVKFYRDRQSLEAGNGYVATITAAAAGATTEVVLGEVLPPPSVVRLVSTGWT